MTEALRVLLLILVGLTLLLVVLLVAVRVSSELIERLTARRQGELRQLILAALLGEPEEAARALKDLRSRDGREWDHVERQAFAMLPKIKGDAHDALATLLLSRGAAGRAQSNARSRSVVRRSRGAYQLGALGQTDAVRTLLGLLADRRFLVRRTTVRALGHVRDPIAVEPLLDAVTHDHALTRDVIAAFQRIGSPAAAALRGDLGHTLTAPPRGRRGALAATAIGLLGDVGAAALLVRALEVHEQPRLPAAAAEALGKLGVRSAVPGLLGALRADSTELRSEAATALGRISDTAAVPGLVAALGDGGREVERSVAGALLRLGSAGHDALVGHPSPYAAEALSLDRLGSAV